MAERSPVVIGRLKVKIDVALIQLPGLARRATTSSFSSTTDDLISKTIPGRAMEMQSSLLAGPPPRKQWALQW